MEPLVVPPVPEVPPEVVLPEVVPPEVVPPLVVPPLVCAMVVAAMPRPRQAARRYLWSCFIVIRISPHKPWLLFRVSPAVEVGKLTSQPFLFDRAVR